MSKQPVNGKIWDLITSKVKEAVESGRFNSPIKAGGRFIQLIQDMLENIDLSSMTEEEFVSKVTGLYDSFVAPLLTGMGPFGVAMNVAARAFVQSWARNFYKKHSHPATN